MKEPAVRPKKLWLAAVIAVGVFALAGIAGRPALNRYATSRAAAILRSSYGELQVTNLHVRLFPGVHVTADEIILPQKNRPGLPPFISLKRLTADAGFAGVLRRPVHIRFVRLEGLEIHVPPRRERETGNEKTDRRAQNIVIDELKADHSSLEILPRNAGKQPLEFELRELTVNDAGTSSPMKFRTILTNAKPPGEIRSDGKFGPLNLDDPAISPVEGSYTFQNADLSVFKGIAGILSSSGKYQGTLDHIGVEGNTDTPDFRLVMSGNPVPLTTRFEAVVDGMNGNTYLDQVNAQLGHTPLTVSGQIDGTKGVPGKTISLNALVTQGRLEDLLALALKGPAPITGAVSFHSKIFIPVGPRDIPEKIHLEGQFKADEAHFRKIGVQERIDKLSDRGRGDPNDDGGDVASNFQGGFNLNNGVMELENFSFEVPGIRVALNGTFVVPGEKLDLHGTATLEAKVSQTVTGFKSFLLKAVDPLFEKKGKGAVLPIKIGGTASAPTFGLDVGKMKK